MRDQTPPPPKDHHLYTYRAQVLKTIDGDTVHARIDVGFHGTHEERLRIRGVDTPELFSGTEKEAAQASRSFVVGWINEAIAGWSDDEWAFLVQTYKDRETFGRYVADLIRRDTMTSLADVLVESGHGRPIKG